MKKIILGLFFIITCNLLLAQNDISVLKEKLKEIADVEITPIQVKDSTIDAYEVMLLQPVDHLNPNNGKKFRQRIFWFHRNINAPTTLVTEGYSARPYIYETTTLTNGNQLSVEHRYFGKSVPDTLDWQFLNTAQAAADHHRIFEIFNQIYKGKWISTGISKGGQTTIFYKYYYPNDMDVWLPYVAPLNFAQEDPRIHTFLDKVGTEDCRNKVLNFQKALLKNRDEILPLLTKRAEEKNYSFPISIDSVFEYAVLEYSFAFWQWGNQDCNAIPSPDSPADELFKHLYTASPFNYFTSNSMKYYAPFFYQAYSEIGYYNYDTKPFKGLLKTLTDEYASNIIFSPESKKVKFNNHFTKDVYKFISEHGNNMLYIYGELDTWSSTSVDIGDKTNAVKMVLKNGHHGTRIKNFEGKEKEKIYSTLSDWLVWEIK